MAAASLLACQGLPLLPPRPQTAHQPQPQSQSQSQPRRRGLRIQCAAKQAPAGNCPEGTGGWAGGVPAQLPAQLRGRAEEEGTEACHVGGESEGVGAPQTHGSSPVTPLDHTGPLRLPLPQALWRSAALALGSVVVGAALALALPSRASAVAPPAAAAAAAAAPAAASSAAAAKAASAERKPEVEAGAPEEEAEGAQEKQAAALAMLEGYLERNPDDVDALKMLLRVRMKTANFPEGLKTLDKLIRLQPQEREWKFLRAQLLEYAGDLPGARQGFEQILAREPFSARALQGLASVMRASGEDSLVLGMVEAAVQRAAEEDKPADVTNLKLLLGQLHAMQGNVAEALAQYDSVLEASPSDFRPYLCKGLVLSLAGDGEAADELFKQFRQRCPKAYAPFLDNVIVRSSLEADRLKREERALQAQGSKARPGRVMTQPEAK